MPRATKPSRTGLARFQHRCFPRRRGDKTRGPCARVRNYARETGTPIGRGPVSFAQLPSAVWILELTVPRDRRFARKLNQPRVNGPIICPMISAFRATGSVCSCHLRLRRLPENFGRWRVIGSPENNTDNVSTCEFLSNLLARFLILNLPWPVE